MRIFLFFFRIFRSSFFLFGRLTIDVMGDGLEREMGAKGCIKP